MSGDQLEEAQVNRLEAVVFEQRRLSHMLRQRGIEIESLRDDRERIATRERKSLEREEELRRGVRSRDEKLEALAADLKEAQYEVRRAERRLDQLKDELREARQQRDGARKELTVVEVERGDFQRELEKSRYEVRRAARRVAKVEGDAREERKRARLQLDSLAAELQEGLATRDEALRARDEARTGAVESLREIEQVARDLGRTQREVEHLVGCEREREVALAESERTLDEVAEHLRRVRTSRSWRWGQALARVLRTVTFRRGGGRSALDVSLERLGAEESDSASG